MFVFSHIFTSMQNRRCLTFFTSGIFAEYVQTNNQRHYARGYPVCTNHSNHSGKCNPLPKIVEPIYKLGHSKRFFIHLYLSRRKCNTNIWLNSCNLHFRGHSTSPSVKVSSFRITATLSRWIRRRWRRKSSFE